MKLTYGIHFRNLKGDIYGGLTAGIVALPLALAFGVASGAGPMAGIYGAVFVGFFAALFGGTPAQVSGPTGPMTVVMAVIITQYAHEPALAFTVVLMGGLFQILFGVLRLGGYINLVPFTVVSGFMSGIGCIILILQFAPLLGQPTPTGGTIDILRHVPQILANIKWDAALVGFAAMAIEDVMVAARDLDMQTIMIGLRKPVGDVLDRLGVLKIVSPENRHADRMAALRQAANIAASRAAQ
jgi:SulP family sulfate permease